MVFVLPFWFRKGPQIYPGLGLRQVFLLTIAFNCNILQRKTAETLADISHAQLWCWTFMDHLDLICIIIWLCAKNATQVLVLFDIWHQLLHFHKASQYLLAFYNFLKRFSSTAKETAIFSIPFSGLCGFMEGAHFPLNSIVHTVIKVIAEHPYSRSKNTDRDFTLSHLKQLLEKASRESEWLRKCKSALSRWQRKTILKVQLAFWISLSCSSQKSRVMGLLQCLKRQPWETQILILPLGVAAGKDLH